MAKSVCMTYLLWLSGGFFGLHHFYLGRTIQGFLWLCFPGGYFGAGWLRDVWRIPSYVREANDDPGYLRDLTDQMRSKKKPPLSFARLGGQLIIGNLFGILITMALPDKDDIGVDLALLGDLVSPAATALGITLVGSIGKEKGSIWWPLLGCYIMTPFYILGYTSYIFTTILGIVAFQTYSKSWRRQIREPHPVCTRLLIVSLCFGLYLSLWGSYVYFNLKITTKDGDKIKFRDAVGNFVKSPAFQEFQQTLGDLYKHMLEHGFWSTLQQLVESLDPLGEKHALKELGLERGASQEEIRGRYKELTKKWHPDMFTDPAEKAEAHERFVGIQQAYERLSAIKKRRKSRNTVSEPGEEPRSEF